MVTGPHLAKLISLSQAVKTVSFRMSLEFLKEGCLFFEAGSGTSSSFLLSSNLTWEMLHPQGRGLLRVLGSYERRLCCPCQEVSQVTVSGHWNPSHRGRGFKGAMASLREQGLSPRQAVNSLEMKADAC